MKKHFKCKHFKNSWSVSLWNESYKMYSTHGPMTYVEACALIKNVKYQESINQCCGGVGDNTKDDSEEEEIED